MMPGLSGWELARILRHERPDLANSLVMVTGADARPAPGFEDLIVLEKPFTPRLLREALGL